MKTSIERNVGFSFLAQVVPLLFAIAALPILVRALGDVRFGLLAIVWAVVGYMGVFDLGLGRALTHTVAQRRASGDQRVDATIVVVTVLLLAMGALAGSGIAAAAPLIVDILRLPPSMKDEATWAFRLVGASVPFLLATGAMRGALEGYEQFRTTALIRVLTSALSFITPVLMISSTRHLGWITASLVAIRFLGLLLHGVALKRCFPALRSPDRGDWTGVAGLLRFGGWMTVTNVVGPLMVTMDRFVIGAVLSVSAVTYYATPYEIVTRLWVVPGAIVAVLFPAFSATAGADSNRASQLYLRGIRVVLLFCYPAAWLLILFAPTALSLWLGADFAARSVGVWRILAVGVLVNCVAQVSFAFVQGSGRPDLTAKLHIVELVPYTAVLLMGLHLDGIRGAAIAWSVRAVADAFALLIMASKMGARGRAAFSRVEAAFLTVLLAVPFVDLPLAHTVLAAAAFSAGFSAWAWLRVISAEDRRRFARHLKALVG